MEEVLDTEFRGRRGRLFWMALRFSILNVLTLGLYRFWMKTRLRRYYWSSVRPGGLPLEYTGRPLEKLLGFLIAVTFLAFYIGLVNLVLMFLSLSLLNHDYGAYAISFVGVIPFIFYAAYRRRRYMMARTRWRGLRFGLAPGAWGYAWRAIGHWLLTILTAGLLWPRMTFWLEKYRTDRTHYGNLRLEQTGRWTMLFPAIVPLILGLLFCAAVIVVSIWQEERQVMTGLVLGLPWLVYGLAHYRTVTFRRLTEAKTAGAIGFRAAPRPWRVFRIYMLGTTLIVLAVLAFFSLLGLVLAAFFAGNLDELGVIAELPERLRGLPTWAKAVLALVVYFNAFVFWDVLTHVFLTFPLWRHFAETLQVTGAPALAAVRQRPRDAAQEAEGFAEALDVGAAI
ncbi:DUF898 family protein [Psychromarinibacter sp. C21-152]|uniref:DUF898 family protein n=1 Tax=Psychromarinibacter sediminicola TaxID=3033385 RepID=A0AAE3T999_9RHOB|nr:DUF898 family protein [Psychromarinibacter sediminicola]MDF0600789.1 DUF898 family protein [Psychromarinibacter sediminicola]